MPGPVSESSRKRRAPLSRQRVLEGAVAIADADGIGALTIRSLAQHLGVKPMSLYYYVANKGEILDAIVDVVFSEIDLPTVEATGDRRSDCAPPRHGTSFGVTPGRSGSWSPATTPGPDTLRHHDAMLGTLRGAGFSIEMTAHAYALIDSYVYGFALQEAALPFDGPETVTTVAVPMMEQFPAGEYPHLVELATQHILQPGYDFGDEFDFGLNLILDALNQSIPSKELS